MRLGFFTVLGSLTLLILTAVMSVAVLQACALDIAWLRAISACTPSQKVATLARLDVVEQENLILQERILSAERALAGQQCVRQAPSDQSLLDDDFWRHRDLAGLYGCWELDSTYRTRDVDTDEIREYGEWQMCFDTAGNGKQRMSAADGTVCTGDVTAQFTDGGFNIVEPGNLACTDGGYIHQRQISCAAGANGSAACQTLQPETGGEGGAGFYRYGSL